MGGGLASPSMLSPQHATEPSVLMPQTWKPPALIWEKEPAGGLACPYSSSLAQQRTLLSILIPQVQL